MNPLLKHPTSARQSFRAMILLLFVLWAVGGLWRWASAPAIAAEEPAVAAAQTAGEPAKEPPKTPEGEGHGGGGGHTDPIAPVLLEVAIVLLAAKIAGHFAEKLRQPAVLGELVVGVLIGSLTLVTPDTALGGALGGLSDGGGPGGLVADIFFGATHLITGARAEGSYLDILARLGVVLLLFEVGLETSLAEMMKVGWAALLVATIGVIVPFALGYGVSTFFIHDFPAGVTPSHLHLFVGATLSATSVGITARVFKDMNKLRTREAKIILGAAVIDDVMGLIILAVVGGIIVADVTAISGGAESASASSIWVLGTITTLKALAFLGAAIFVGRKLAPIGFRLMAGLRGAGLLITSALAFCFVLSYLASAVGLAPIVGAFAAGLVLEEVHIRPFLDPEEQGSDLKHNALGHQLHPVAGVMVPIFFVLMGIQVKLETFLQTEVLFLAACLTGAAIIGKQACSLVVKGNLASRITIGFGMIPRGEVGLIFASIGRSLGVVSDSTFSAIVIMVIVTTLATPPLLKLSMVKIHNDPDEEPAAA